MLKPDAVPSISLGNESSEKSQKEMCNSNDSVCNSDDMNDGMTSICACSSDCEKIDLVKQVKELREKLNSSEKENQELKNQYRIATTALAKKNSELKKKVVYNQTKVFRLSNTKSKLNGAIKELKRRQLLTDKQYTNNLKVLIY